MKKILLGALIGLVMVVCTANGAPLPITDLLTVYQQALQSDPTFLQAKAQCEALKEVVPQSRAALLPNANASATTLSTHVNTNLQTATESTSDSSNAHDYTLTITQPIFNLQSWMQLRAARHTVKQAEATYNAAIEDLMVRVASAYFNVLQAQDNLRFTNAEKTATANQLKQIKAKYQVGLATMTDVYQAQATYDSLVAQEISAQNTINNNLQALQQMTGQTYATLAPLKAVFPLISPTPDHVMQWINVAEQQNWTLLAARYAQQAAKENIRVSYAGHFPTVNAVGEYQNGNNLGANPTNNMQWETNVGVQVNVPLFQGGLVTSQTRQAQDNYVAASEQMEASHRQVIFNTQQAFNNIVAGISKIQADNVALTSAKSALDSTSAGYHAGTQTILDVLTAEQNLYQAQANLAADRYSYLNNTLALKQAAGTLSQQDIIAINQWLTKPSV